MWVSTGLYGHQIGRMAQSLPGKPPGHQATDTLPVGGHGALTFTGEGRSEHLAVLGRLLSASHPSGAPAKGVRPRVPALGQSRSQNSALSQTSQPWASPPGSARPSEVSLSHIPTDPGSLSPERPALKGGRVSLPSWEPCPAAGDTVLGSVLPPLVTRDALFLSQAWSLPLPFHPLGRLGLLHPGLLRRGQGDGSSCLSSQECVVG